MLELHPATRYVVPLREGGSLPAVVDTDGGGLFVAKFRGAGQGAKALVAELLVGAIGRALGLPVPELALIELDESFGRTERDPEIQDVLKGSRGLNVGMRYLEGAFNFDPRADEATPELAADVVWLDALVTNVDRTFKNPNLMWHDGHIWLIDHGAALYFHHNWAGCDDTTPLKPFDGVKDHVLLGETADLAEADARLAPRLDRAVLEAIVGELPDALLMDAPEGQSPPYSSAEENRGAYLRYLSRRLEAPRSFVAGAVEATAARRSAKSSNGERKSYRR